MPPRPPPTTLQHAAVTLAQQLLRDFPAGSSHLVTSQSCVGGGNRWMSAGGRVRRRHRGAVVALQRKTIMYSEQAFMVKLSNNAIDATLFSHLHHLYSEKRCCVTFFHLVTSLDIRRRRAVADDIHVAENSLTGDLAPHLSGAILSSDAPRRPRLTDCRVLPGRGGNTSTTPVSSTAVNNWILKNTAANFNANVKFECYLRHLRAR
ncbi:hypothetical protein EVAR_64109_1 [Eumeta japonica]|uniref:Uncharacterized protein n=1 Tax=Eumeta variegata TaxID=151549 RepID=A0A4C1ZGN8_EUMVA|nr:hypothetical protein EVAR_64109_1 [Eumeta japonica]